jgi:hypothetical protein
MIPRISRKAFYNRQYSSAAHSEAYSKLVSRSWAAPTDGSAHKNFIGGQFVDSKASTFYDVHDPVSPSCMPDLTIGHTTGGIQNTANNRRRTTRSVRDLGRVIQVMAEHLPILTAGSYA